MRLVLASTSPRRSRLLKDAGYEFEVCAPSSEEKVLEGPESSVVSNSVSKARSVKAGDDALVIGADTLVVCDGEVLGKPRDREDARRMLSLQLTSHQDVITGVCVRDARKGREMAGFEVSRVELRGSTEALEGYLGTGLWEGKAGGYGIQDISGLEVVLVHGERDNVEGLPMTLLRRLLSLSGFEYPDRTPSEGDGVLMNK